MRIPSIVSTGLLLVALPVHAQEPAVEPGPAGPVPGAPEPAPAAPAPAPPAPAEPAAPAAPAAPEANVEASAEMDTGASPAMQGGGEEAPPPASREEPASTSVGGPAEAADSSWTLEYHGYFRAPMRVGMGKREDPGEGQSKTTLHYPVIPDDQYLSWQSTSHNKKDWAEMFFTYGNRWVKGTLALQGFNFTDAAWNYTEAQFGISQGYITLAPDLGFEDFRLEAKVGSAWNRYGMAGKWDAGEYDTYLFGRTHVMGETVRVEFDPDLANTLWAEEGLGAKRPDPKESNNARFTMLAHGHVGWKMGATMELSAHYMHAWTQEEDRILIPENTFDTTSGQLNNPYAAPAYPSALMGLPDGKLDVYGMDARFELNAFGYFYAGFSHIEAKKAISVAPAIEVLHSFGGGQFQLGVTDNYFGPSCIGGPDPVTGLNTNAINPYRAAASKTPRSVLANCSLGDGSVNTILAQYDFSVQNFIQQFSGGQKFWGEGQDFSFSLYGMLNKVSSDVERYDGITKLKYGTDLRFQALPWLTIATRYDRVQPHSDIPEQSFSILSPRLVFQSKWVTREELSLQYSRYIYNQRTCEAPFNPAYNTSGAGGPDPYAATYNDGQLECVQPPAAAAASDTFGSTYENQAVGYRGAPTTTPDENVIKIEANMWW